MWSSCARGATLQSTRTRARNQCKAPLDVAAFKARLEQLTTSTALPTVSLHAPPPPPPPLPNKKRARDDSDAERDDKATRIDDKATRVDDKATRVDAENSVDVSGNN